VKEILLLAIRRPRRRLSCWLFDLATRVYAFHPTDSVLEVSEAHHVGDDRWVHWKVRNLAEERRREARLRNPEPIVFNDFLSRM